MKMQRCASYDDQRAEVQCSSSCLPELDVRPLHGHRNQGSLVAWPSCNWPQGRRICAGTRYLFCWIHPFVLLQPLSPFAIIPIRFFMNIWIFAGTGARFCWNQLVDMLQGRHHAGGSCIQWQGGLRPTPFERRKLQPCTLELHPATRGAARGVAIFC